MTSFVTELKYNHLIYRSAPRFQFPNKVSFGFEDNTTGMNLDVSEGGALGGGERRSRYPATSDCGSKEEGS